MINVIIGGLIALAGQCLMWFITTKTSQKEILSREHKAQQYLAAQLIITLDEYVGDCYNTVQDPLQEDKDGYARATVPDPTLTLPEGDYSIFETQLMYSILRLPSKNRNTVEGLPDFYDDPPSYDSLFRFRREQFSELGLLAASVVKKLCMEYRLPMPEKDSHYKPEDTFQECISVNGDIGELKRRRREAYAYRETQKKVGTA